MALDLLGIVVNPKAQRPVLAAWDGDEVLIYRLDKDVAYEGRGNYDPGGSEYSKPQMVTGLPRVHTPSGIQTKGQGYGTALYTALCLGAHADHEDIARLGIYEQGDGICSDAAGRSGSADRWWTLAKKLGLAQETEGEYEEEDVDLSYDVSASDLDACGIAGDRSVSSVNALNVDLVEHIPADVYLYDEAWRNDLAVAEMYYEASSDRPRALRRVWEQIVSDKGESVYDVNWQAICASDVRGLDAEAMNLLAVLCRHAGADEAAVDAMRIRWDLGLDPSVGIRQQRLPFKMNAEDAALARASVDVASELRQGLDWGRLSALP